MPLNLDSCIAGVFTPGNIPASSGLPPVQPIVPSFGPIPTIEEDAEAFDTYTAFMGELLHEVANATDSYTALGGAYVLSIAEVAHAVDAPSIAQTYDVVVGEVSGSTADNPSVLEPGVHDVSIAETATAADAVNATIPASAWTPADLGAVLRAWYKFDTLTGSNNDPIGAVTDASANGFNLSQTGLNRPTLQVAEQNSLNTLRFTAANAQNYILSNSILSGSSAGSVYIVYKIVSDSANNGLMDWGGSGNQSHWPYLDGTIYCDFGANVRHTVGNPSVTQTTYRIVSIYSAASDWAFYLDGGTGGSSGGTSPLQSTTFSSVAWNTALVGLGTSTAVGPAYLDGWIAEVFFTNAKQSTTDRQKAEGYLAHKWGLTGNLDTSHPYKSSPP